MDTVNIKATTPMTLKSKARWVSLERIPFDAAYWATLNKKLDRYYLTHFIKTTASEFAKYSSATM